MFDEPEHTATRSNIFGCSSTQANIPIFTYSACGRFTENKKRIEKLTEPGNSRYIY